MIRESTLDQLRPHVRDYLMQYMGRNPDKPFSCVDPAHPDKHPSGYYGANEHIVGCHSCHCRYNLFSLIGLNEGISDFQGQVERAAQLYGVKIEYEKGKEGRRSTPQEDFSEPPEGQNHTKIEPLDSAVGKLKSGEDADYTAFYAEAHKHINETEYHRGLSAAVLNRFNLGYVAEWRHPKVEAERQKGRYQNVPSSPRLIIPTSAHSYLARDTRPDTDTQYRKQKVGRVAIFNIEALRSAARPVFLTEGEIDALSIIEAGGEAVALGSTSYTDIFFRSLDSILKAGAQITQPIIICLDNDAAGADAAGKLEEGLRERGLSSYRRDISGAHKDANEALVSDRAGLEAAIAAAEEEAKAEAAAEEETERQEFLRSISIDLSLFEQGIKESANTPCMPTGFEALDLDLDGGLYPGLYILGAVTSAGKTALVMQIADQVAAAGHHVIIISLEMATTELVSRSISRHTLIRALGNEIDTKNCKTARGITDGKRWKAYNPIERKLIYDSIDDYAEYSDRIKVKEGIGDIGAAQIRDIVERYIRYTGERPLLVVDYLQIMSPTDVHLSDKQNMDRAVLELKRISRDFRIPVFTIASLNRNGYKETVEMQDFKESGAIEYSADVLLGYQFAGAKGKDFDFKAAKAKNPREMELVILKNRAGAIPKDPARFRYYPAFNAFFEAE